MRIICSIRETVGSVTDVVPETSAGLEEITFETPTDEGDSADSAYTPGADESSANDRADVSAIIFFMMRHSFTVYFSALIRRII